MQDPQVINQAVYWVSEDRRFPMDPAPPGTRYRVWTLYSTDPNVRPELPMQPVHHHNAFLEDYVHDWNLNGGVFRYYSRAVHSKVWILVETLKGAGIGQDAKRRRRA